MQKGAGHVGFHLPVPFLARQLHERLVENAAGVVDEHVQLAESLHRQGDRLLGDAVLRDIGNEGHETRAGQALNVRIDVFGHDFGAARMKELRDSPADTAGRTGHQYHFAFDFLGDVGHNVSFRGFECVARFRDWTRAPLTARTFPRMEAAISRGIARPVGVLRNSGAAIGKIDYAR
jgi:hypothetical protein